MANNIDDDMMEGPSSEVDSLLKNVQDMGDLYFVALLVLAKLEPSSKNQNHMIAELSYLLDTQSFINLLWYFEGETIRIPTRDELKEVLTMMSLYYQHEVLGKVWKDACSAVGLEGNSHYVGKIWNRYQKFKKTLNSVQLPKKLRRPDMDDKLKMDQGGD